MRTYILLFCLTLIGHFAMAQCSVEITNAVVQNVNCGNNGAISVDVDLGCAPYDAVWSNGLVGLDIGDLAEGEYGVTITDCFGCTIDSIFYVPGESNPLLMVYEDIPGCLGNTTVTGGCPPYMFYVNDIILTQSTPICTYPEGDYIMSVLDDCGCTISQDIIIQNEIPLSIVLDELINPGCLGDSDGAIDISIIGNPPFTYYWSNGASSEDISGLLEGFYTVTVTDNFGLTAVQTYELIYASQTDLVITNATIIDADCMAPTGGGITLEVEGGCPPYLYIWNNGSTSDTITDLTAGDYEVTILDCTGCGTIADFIVEQASPIIVDIQTSPGCIDEINATGGCGAYTYFIGGLSIPGFPYCNLAIGTYEVEVVDACGCQAFEIITIDSAPDLLIIHLDTLIHPSCTGEADGAIDIWVSGGTPGYTFQWDTGASSEDVENLTEGAYTVTVTDAVNNTAAASFNLTDAPDFLENYTITCESESGGDGSIELTPNPVGFTYAYSWSNLSTDQNQYNLTSGFYAVTVTNIDQNCEYYFGPFFVCHDSLQLNMDTTVCAGTEVILDAEIDDTITFLNWSGANENDIDCVTCAVTSVYPHETRTYSAHYYSETYGDFTYDFTISVIEDCVWPGDADNSKEVDQFDLFPMCIVYGATGPARVDQSIDWYGHPADEFGINVPVLNIDAKHVDCNGNGIVNLGDTTAIYANWGETHKSLTVGKKEGTPIFIGQDTIYEEGATITLPLIVGTMDTMATDIYAIGFSIYFDPEIMVDGTASLALDETWFTTGSNPMGIVQKEFATAGRLDVAIGRTDLMNVSGSGRVADFIITMEDDILKVVPDKKFEISVSNARIINVQGQELEANGLTTTSVYIDSSTVDVSDLESLQNRFHIFPNPVRANDELQIETSLEVEKYKLLNLNGQVIANGKIRKGNSSLKLSTALSAGLYIIRVEGAFGQLNKKLIIK